MADDDRQAALQAILFGKGGEHAFDSEIADAVKGTDVPFSLAKATMVTESSGDPMATSPKGAKGLMQLMPDTAKRHGVDDPHDPKQSIKGGVSELDRLMKKYDGDAKKALAAYNAGERAVDEHDGVPPFKETKDYVQKVEKRRATYQEQRDKGLSDLLFGDAKSEQQEKQSQGVSRETRIRMLQRQEGSPDYTATPPAELAMAPTVTRGALGLVPVVGGGAGEAAAEVIEKAIGQREAIDPKLIALQSAIGLVPGAAEGKTALGTVARGAAKSALLGEAGTVGTTLEEQHRLPTLKEALAGAGVGGAIGAVGGAAATGGREAPVEAPVEHPPEPPAPTTPQPREITPQERVALETGTEAASPVSPQAQAKRADLASTTEAAPAEPKPRYRYDNTTGTFTRVMETPEQQAANAALPAPVAVTKAAIAVAPEIHAEVTRAVDENPRVKAMETAVNENSPAMSSWLHIESPKAVRQIKGVFAPERLPEGERAAMTMQPRLTRAHLEQGVTIKGMEGLQKLLKKEPDQGFGILDHYENGRIDQIPARMRPYFQAFREASDDVHRQIKATGEDIGFIEGWAHHFYNGDPAEVTARLKQWKDTAKTPAGSRTFAKTRVLPTYKVAREFGLEPRLNDPVELMQKGLEMERRYLAMRGTVDDGIKAGLWYPKKAEEGLLPGEGWIKDSHRNPWSVPGVGTVAGPEDAVRILNNTVAGGIWEAPDIAQKAYTGYLVASNAVNAGHVGLSGFHFTFGNAAMAMDEAGGALAHGIGAALSGDMREAARNLGRFAASPIRGIRDALSGGKTLSTLNKMKAADPAYDQLMDALTMTGARLYKPQIMQELERGRTSAEALEWKPFVQAWGDVIKDAATLKGGLRGEIGNVLKASSYPVMEFIRRAKIGAGVRMYSEETMRAMSAKGGALTLGEKQAIGHGIMEHLNNVLGQVPREQLYFARGMKDWMQIAFAFPKWQLGSVRLASSAGTGGLKLLGAKPFSQLSVREQKAVNFALGAVMVHGTVMALTNRMLTGEWPSTFKDFIAARTGYKDDNGNPQRLWMPDYFRTYYSMYQNPIRWLGSTVSPLVSDLYHVLTNMDYWGNQIYNPQDPMLQRAIQMGRYEIGNLKPFSLQAAERMKQAIPDHPTAATAASLMGAQPTPRTLMQTSTQNMADEISRRKYGSMTPEGQDDAAAKRRVIEAAKSGKAPDPEDLATLSRGKQLALAKGPLSGRRRFDRTVEHFGWDDLAALYQNAKAKGEDTDLDSLRTVIATKVRRGMSKPGLGMSERDLQLYMPLILEATKPKEESESMAVER